MRLSQCELQVVDAEARRLGVSHACWLAATALGAARNARSEADPREGATDDRPGDRTPADEEGLGWLSLASLHEQARTDLEEGQQLLRGALGMCARLAAMQGGGVVVGVTRRVAAAQAVLSQIIERVDAMDRSPPRAGAGRQRGTSGPRPAFRS